MPLPCSSILGKHTILHFQGTVNIFGGMGVHPCTLKLLSKFGVEDSKSHIDYILKYYKVIFLYQDMHFVARISKVEYAVKKKWLFC